MTLLASTASDAAYWGLAVFLVAIGLAAAFMLFRLGQSFERLSSFIKGTERDLLPVIVKTGGTVDRVNYQLDKADTVTDSAVSMADSADTAVRAVSTVITTPVEKVIGLRRRRHARLLPVPQVEELRATRRPPRRKRRGSARRTSARICARPAARRWRPSARRRSRARRPQPKPDPWPRPDPVPKPDRCPSRRRTTRSTLPALRAESGARRADRRVGEAR